MNSKLQQLIDEVSAKRPPDLAQAIAYLRASRAYKIAMLEAKIVEREVQLTLGRPDGSVELDPMVVNSIPVLEFIIGALEGKR